MKCVIEASHAIAEGVKLSDVKVIAAYPITPQTHIVEKLAEMVANGELDAEFLNVESEHSALAVCIGAQASGVRSFTATASQGLALMWELLYVASGMRLPIVMAIANRALSAPLNIWNDWSDSIGARDSGWLQFYCKNAQEALDTTMQVYKISEHKNVMLPSMVCVDGFFLSHVHEIVDIPKKPFVTKYKPLIKLDIDNPVSMGCYATPEYYQEFKKAQYHAMENAKKIILKINKEFYSKYNRKYGNGLIEIINPECKYAIVSMGSVCETIEATLPKDITLIRIRTFRPFPKEDLSILNNFKSISVIEKDVSFGLGGALATEIKSIVSVPVLSVITGLGGKDVNKPMLEKIYKEVRLCKNKEMWL